MGKTFVYNYDKHGNITSRVEYSYTTATNLSTLTPTKTDTFSYYTSGWQDQLKKVNNGTEIVYDYQGKPTSYNGKIFTWSTSNLQKITTNSKEFCFIYDAQGKLQGKTYYDGNNRVSENYYYDGGRLVYNVKYVNSNPTLTTFLYNQQGVCGITCGSSYTFRKNVFGDITEIYQGTTCVAKYKYDAWGNCTVCNPDGTVNTSENFIGNLNPFRYRGYYWDKHAEMYYLQTRWYDPTVCRFISPDSYEYLDPTTFGGLNLYAYCVNNPIMYSDPSGHFWDYVFDAVFIGWGISDLINGGYKDWKNWVTLGVDILFAVLPFVPTGTGQVIKVGNKIDNAVDVVSAINKVDNINDITNLTIIGRSMDRVRDVAVGIGRVDDIYDMWKGYDNTATGLKQLIHNGISVMHNASWMFGKLRYGYTILDIGITTLHRGWGIYYGVERFVIGLWKTRNIWKLPINYYL